MFLVSLLLSGFILAEEIVVDVSSSQVCDAIYNPPNCRGGEQSNHKSNLRSNVGIDLGSTPTAMPDYRPQIRIIDRRRGQPDTRRVIGRPRAEDLLTDGSEISPTEAGADPSTSQPGSPSINNNGAFSQGANPAAGTSGGVSSAMSSTGSFGNGTSSSGSQGRVVNGFIYTPEDEPPGVTPPPNNEKRALSPSISAATKTAVDLNKENNKTSSPISQQGGPSLPAASFGQFESGKASSNANTQTQKKNGNSFINRLKNLASKLLGGKYFGLNGSSSGNKQLGKTLHNRQRRNGSSGKNVTNAGPDVKGLLQERMDRYRGIASQLEFASSKTNLFGHLCKHYKAYARKNSISNLPHNCPK